MDVIDVPPAETAPRVDGDVREHRTDAVQAEAGDICGHLNALHGRLVELIATVLDEGLWHQAGIRSPEHWATWQLGVSGSTARRLVSAARRRSELPATMAALTAGELSFDQVTPIVDTAPAWADARVTNLARYATVTQIRRIVRGYPHRDACEPDTCEPDTTDADSTDADSTDADSADTGRGSQHPVSPEPEAPLDPTTPHDAHGPVDPHRAEGVDLADLDTADPERLSLVQQPDGSWRLWGRLDADHGHLLDAALREIADGAHGDHGTRPSRAAALVMLAERHLGALEPARRSRYRVHYLVDEHLQLVDPHGTTLPSWLRELITCDADASITWQRHGTPVAHSNQTPNIPTPTRQHVLRRDQRRCRLCGGTGHHLHHIHHREHGGTHHPSNLVLLCGPCHRLHHRHIITISGNPQLPDDHADGLCMVDTRTRRRLRPNTLVRPPTGPPPAPASDYRHPTGERLEPRWIDFDPPPERTANADANANAAA